MKNARIYLLPRLRRSSILCVVLFLLVASISRAQGGSADEYEIRAAMLFNLTRYIEWPAAKNDAAHKDFLICLLGSDPLGASLDSLLHNKTVGTRPVVLRHVNSAELASDCHILYVGSGGDKLKNFARAAADLQKAGVLSISERANANNSQQIVGLPIVDQHIRIDVNLPAAQRSGLIFSSKVLHLATVTH